MYVGSTKYGIVRTEKQPHISLSLDFVEKPPSLISPLSIKPPLEGSKINMPLGSLIELLPYLHYFDSKLEGGFEQKVYYRPKYEYQNTFFVDFLLFLLILTSFVSDCISI